MFLTYVYDDIERHVPYVRMVIFKTNVLKNFDPFKYLCFWPTLYTCGLCNLQNDKN